MERRETRAKLRLEPLVLRNKQHRQNTALRFKLTVLHALDIRYCRDVSTCHGLFNLISQTLVNFRMTSKDISRKSQQRSSLPMY